MSIYSMNYTYQDTKNLNHKTYRNQNLKLPQIRTTDYTQTHTQTELTTPYHKTYQNRTVTRNFVSYGTVSKTKNQGSYM